MANIDISRIQFGATAWSYEMLTPGDVVGFRRVAEKVAKLPFPKRAEVIEILDVLDEESYKTNCKAAKEKKEIADDLGLRIIVTGFTPHSMPYHLTSEDYDEKIESIERMKRGLLHASFVAEPGQGILNGPSYMRHEYFPEEGLRSNEHGVLVDILQNEISPFASSLGVRAALEPLNHDEGYLLEPGNEALGIIERVGKPNIGLNLDTVHYAQNAEGGVVESLSMALKEGVGFTLHLSEHNRKKWGTGDIGERTYEILQAVSSSIPEGRILPVTLENFCPALHKALRIHRPDRENPETVVYEGARLIRDYINLNN